MREDFFLKNGIDLMELLKVKILWVHGAVRLFRIKTYLNTCSCIKLAK